MEQTLPNNVISLMKSLDFTGTVHEYYCLLYMIECIINKENPYIENRELASVVKRWENAGWITMKNDIIISMHEGFIDRAFKIIKEFGKSYIIEKSFHHSYVLVEGPDGSGKTSLMIELWKDRDLSQFYIYDRGIISDVVYSEKFDRESYKGIDIDTYIDYHRQKTLHLPNIKIVLCQADADVLYERCLSKNDPIIAGKKKEDIIEELRVDSFRFTDETQFYCDKYCIPYIIIDTTKDTLEHSVAKVKSFILGREINYESI